MHPQLGAVPMHMQRLYARGALVAHLHSSVPPRLKLNSSRGTYTYLQLCGLKSRADASLLA